MLCGIDNHIHRTCNNTVMEEKRKFTGFIISGEPVTTKKAREAGIIKKSKVIQTDKKKSDKK